MGGTREKGSSWWWKEVRWKKEEGEERLKRDRANVHPPPIFMRITTKGAL